MTSTKPFLLFLLALLATAAARPAAAEEAADDAKGRAARLEEMQRQAGEYTVTTAAEIPIALALHDEPLLRFSNPVSGVPDGIVVMWKEGARPAIFAQVFQTKEGLWIHECQSFAPRRLSMSRGEASVWQPAAASDEFRRLDDAPVAVDSALRRLPQMKAIATEFAAWDDFKIHLSDKETTRHALRMLPTPVYRYQDSAEGITDGAVFAFVHGTDPEAFLVLEHRAGDGDKPAWYYTFAPMTCWAVEAKRGEAQVWSVPERQGKSTAKEPYHVWVYRKSPPQ